MREAASMALLVALLLTILHACSGCTPSSTQWEHQREQYQRCLDEYPDSADRDNYCKHLRD